nr:hypothetical protein [bacterium]
MIKNFKYLLLSLSFIGLFSCASNNNIDDGKNENQYTTEVAVYNEEVENTISDEEKQYVEDLQTENLLESIENSDSNKNANVPVYQARKKNVKKVETKKILIKPVTNVTSAPYNFSDEEIKAFLEDVENKEGEDEGYDIKNIKVLMDNYKNILQTSSACCISNMTESFKVNGVSREDVLRILIDDRENLSAQDKCLILSEDEIFDSFGDEYIADLVVKAREVCICNNKDFLRKNLNNFYRIYNADSEFYDKSLIYRYKDKYGRIV